MTTTSAFAPRFDLSNVFLSAREPIAIAEEGFESSYALVKSGPAVNADEVESHVDAVEITVRWGNQVLKVSHLDQGESFYVGEGCELALPEDVLGAAKAPVVLARGQGAVVIAPPGSHGTVSLRGATSNFSGANELPLSEGMSVHLEIGATRTDGTSGEPITFEIGTVRKGREVAPVGFLATLAGGATGFVGLSFLGHAAIVASMAMFMPSMGNSDETIDRDQMMMMQKLLNASAEREHDQLQDLAGPSDAPSGGGSEGEAHKGESGEAGTTAHVTTKGRMSVKGNENHAELSPKAERQLAAEFGMAGLVATANFDPKAPQSPWATSQVGNEKDSHWGDMFSPEIGDAAGYGVGLTGTGEGGGGTGAGVGVGRIGTIGGAGGTGPWGFGPGDKGGMGNGHGTGGAGHTVKQITPIREGNPVFIGRLPADVIQRIVRQNFGRFRNCYESALRTNPSLTGRVSTHFTIGRDGSVTQANDAGSDLPDQNVVSCVVRSFQSLSFPSPEGGVANVTYPIILTPGE